MIKYFMHMQTVFCTLKPTRVMHVLWFNVMVSVMSDHPPPPLTTEEMDYVFDLPYARLPHPAYGDARFPAFDMIKFSVNIMRGCFGGCTFCSITEHEGRIIKTVLKIRSYVRSRKFVIQRRTSPVLFQT